MPSMPDQQQLDVDLHVRYIQQLDTVGPPQLHLQSPTPDLDLDLILVIVASTKA